MRTHKYHAWDTFDKRMIRWEECLENATLIAEILLHAERYIPLQYTGLTDKNGKEIYEGDIVAWDRTDNRGRYSEVVGWNNNLVCFSPIPGANAEIIGNIYESPELLTLNL